MARDPTTTGLMRIGEVADRVGLSLRTVRYYEEQGLIDPEARTDGGFRLYSEEQAERLLLIKQMKPLGFTVAEMRDLLRARDDLARGDGGARGRLDDFARGADERVGRLRSELERAEAFAAALHATLDG